MQSPARVYQANLCSCKTCHCAEFWEEGWRLISLYSQSSVTKRCVLLLRYAQISSMVLYIWKHCSFQHWIPKYLWYRYLDFFVLNPRTKLPFHSKDSKILCGSEEVCWTHNPKVLKSNNRRARCINDWSTIENGLVLVKYSLFMLNRDQKVTPRQNISSCKMSSEASDNTGISKQVK